MKFNTKQVILTLLASIGLILFFLFQKIDFVSYVFQADEKITRFLLNRFFRFLVNDALAILLIYALFVERKYVVFALWVQLFGFVFFLLPYFVIKIYWPDYNGPLINFLHRLILNPTLIMLLIPAYYYQRKIKKS